MSNEIFIGDWYKLQNLLKVYNSAFEPIPTEGEPRWLTGIDFSMMMHDEDVEKKKGRKKSTRIKNAMNFQALHGKN